MMRDELRQLVQEQGLARVVIVDDAFDEYPTSRQVIEHAQAFVDSLVGDKFGELGQLLGHDDMDEDTLETLLEQDDFVAHVYREKDRVPPDAFQALFSAYEFEKLSQRDELVAISDVLTDIGLEVIERGSNAGGEHVQADIVLIDLFFDNMLSADDAASDAAEKIKSYLPDRTNTDDPAPLVVLISTRQPDLDLVYQRFRDCAQVPGCRFTFLHKRVFREAADEALFRLLQLVQYNEQSRQFDLFVRRMDIAATEATDQFLSKLRELELSDYADLSELIVRAEGIPLREYLLELYAMAWASFAESSEGIVHALEGLDRMELTVDQYPPNAFVPSNAVLELYESALYRPASALGEMSEFAHLGLGDIFIGTDAIGEITHVYLVVVQDCDMARDAVPDAAFFIEGRLEPAEKSRAVQNKFPITLQERRYSVRWNDKDWRAVRGDDFDEYVADKSLSRVMRLRSPWSLMRQTEFFGRLARPATMASPHEIDAVDIEFLLADKQSRARTIREFSQQPAGFLLHGRNAEESEVRLVLSESCASELRSLLRDNSTDEELCNQQTRDWICTLLENPEQLRSLHTHLEVNAQSRKMQRAPLISVGVALKTSKHWTDGTNTGGTLLMINAERIVSEPADVDEAELDGQQAG